MDIFADKETLSDQPLASRMRPRNLDEFIGQEHIVGPGRLLRRAIAADRLSSLILYGPPGVGKTTLARVIAAATKSRFINLNAVLSGVKELREAIEQAQEQKRLYARKTILFVDEVHRWNKSQQDALLPWTENGLIVLIGATTENPFFEVNRALVSRSRIFQMLPLSEADLLKAARLAVQDRERGYGKYRVLFEKGALEHMAAIAAGDCRTLYNALELAVETAGSSFPPAEGAEIYVALATAEESIQKKALLYDKEGDFHFDAISAFIKSLRGSDPDAALYWMARMLASGEDPDFILRRMLISASEDVGMADPNALAVVMAAAQAYKWMGLPEGRFPLAQAALYLATAPKSNSALGFFDAQKSVEEEGAADVPNHLRDASRDKKGFGHGEGYKYPHAFAGHWTAQAYLPNALKGRVFYHPSDQGYEGRLRQEIFRKREEQLAVLLNDDEEHETLTFTPQAKTLEREGWIRRAEGAKSAMLRQMRSDFFDFIQPARNSRILLSGDESGYFLAEALRRAPEGGVFALFAKPDKRAAVAYAYKSMDLPEQPELLEGSLLNFPPETDAAAAPLPGGFEEIILYMPKESPAALAAKAKTLLAPGGSLGILAPGVGSKLSDFLEASTPAAAKEALIMAEKSVYAHLNATVWRQACSDSGLPAESRGFAWEENRFVGEGQLSAWFAADSLFGSRVSQAAKSDKTVVKRLRQGLASLERRNIVWNRQFWLIKAKRPW